MKKSVHFLFDEEWDEQAKELQQIIHESENPKLHKDVYILESLMRACAFTFIKQKQKSMPAILGSEIQKPRYYQKVINIQAGSEVQPIPIPSTQENIQPVHEFKDVPKFMQKTVIEQVEQEEKKKDRIKDKITERVLASRELNDHYIINEPMLNEKDKKTLQKVIKKSPKNMEKGWKLIQK